MEQKLPPQNNNPEEALNDLKSKAFTKVIWALLGFLVILFMAVIAWVNFSKATKNQTEIVPVSNFQSSQDTPIQSPESLFNNTIEPNNRLFNSDKILIAFPVLRHQKAYYLKNGDIWVADLAKPQNKPKILLDIKEEILSFDISNNQDFLAYSIKRNLSKDDDGFSAAYGDTILIRNLKNSSEFELYLNKNSEDMQIRSILFSPDDKKLFFSNNSIWIADLATKSLKKYATLEKNSFCSIYFLEDISSDGQRILARIGCMEGSSQVVFNVATGEIEGTFDNGYVEGGTWAYGFLTNNLLLAVNNERKEETENLIVRLGVYDVLGKLIKQIQETNDFPLYFDNKSVAEKIFISLPSDKPTIKNQSIYELNLQTFTLDEFSSKKDIVAILYDNGNNSIWLTDTVLENPIFIDANVKVRRADDISLKLK